MEADSIGDGLVMEADIHGMGAPRGEMPRRIRPGGRYLCTLPFAEGIPLNCPSGPALPRSEN